MGIGNRNCSKNVIMGNVLKEFITTADYVDDGGEESASFGRYP